MSASGRKRTFVEPDIDSVAVKYDYSEQAAEDRQEKCLLPVYCQLPYGMPNLSIYRLDFSLTGYA